MDGSPDYHEFMTTVIWLLQNLVISVLPSSPPRAREREREREGESHRIFIAQLPDKLIGLRSVVAPGAARERERGRDESDRSMGNGNRVVGPSSVQGSFALFIVKLVTLTTVICPKLCYSFDKSRG